MDVYGSLYQPALFEHNQNSLFSSDKIRICLLENFECVSLLDAVFFASFFFEKK
jgi:hypothetical protein